LADPLTSCASLVGSENFACISAATNFWLGYMLLILFWSILYWRLNTAVTPDRVASSLFATVVLAYFLSIVGLVSSNVWSRVAILLVGAGALLMFKN